MVQDRTESLGSRRTAAVGWTATAVVALIAVERLLAEAYLWSAMAVVVAVALALPAVATRSPTAMVPWPLSAIAAVAVVLRAAEVATDVSGYLAISTLALVLVVELVVYTEVALTRRFAVVFATMTTMALQAVWIIAQFYSDRLLETNFLVSQAELQWDIVYVTVVSIALGVLVERSLERFDLAGSFSTRSSR